MTATASYPASLPPPITQGFELDDVPPVLRSDMDSGHARQRLRNTSLLTSMPIMFRFTQWQLMIFNGWRRWTIGYTGWFTVMLLGDFGLQPHEARFDMSQPPKVPLQKGGFWYVQANLEVRDRPMLSADDFAWIVNENPDDLFAAIAAVHSVTQQIFEGSDI